MKLTWKNSKKRPLVAVSKFQNLPFENSEDEPEASCGGDAPLDKKEKVDDGLASLQSSDSSDAKQLAHSFQTQGDKLADDGKYREALGKWEAALTLIPGNAVLHEQKAQVLLEIGDSWNALKSATRATELEPSWAELFIDDGECKISANFHQSRSHYNAVLNQAWITLGRAQLNFGEPDSAVESFDKALAIKPDSGEVQEDKRTAFQLVQRRKQLHSEGLSSTQNRYVVGDQNKSS